MTGKTFLSCALALLAGVVAKGQRTLDYDNVVVPQNRIDARDLGYPPVDVIPNGESAITALTVAPNGHLYGATSGKRSHLFVLSPRHGYVQPLGYIPDTTAVTALAVSKGGDVYIGTSPGGRLLKYDPHGEDERPININEPLRVSDLGVAVSGESISALVIDRKDVVYGLTSPNAHLLTFAIQGGRFKDLGVVATKLPPGEKFETQKVFSRMLALNAEGLVVYASGEDGYLYRFANETPGLEKLPLQVPAVPGREPWTRVDTFVTDPSGLIYGGTSDGYLFRFDPDKLKVDNLGKPLLQYRITGLVRGSNGRLYGIGGDEDDMARLFSYDPGNGTYEILGFVDVNRRSYYSWQAYVIKAMAAGLDGTIYIGQSERISKLYLFYPW
jgi:hypothetical protein